MKNAALAAAATGLSPLLRAARRAPLPVALQLYSVRGDCAKDFDGTLEWAARQGFDGVEFAGYYQYADNPKGLRRRLDDLGLRGIGAHLGTDRLRGDALKRTIEFHRILGCHFLIVPGDHSYTDPEGNIRLAEFFNLTAELLRPYGMLCGYHNHTKEFTKVGDTTYFDLFAQRTSQAVVLQQDCGWTAAAGYDPAEMMRRYPGRMKSTHYKPTVVGHEPGKKAILGQDSVDWAEVLEVSRTIGGTEWITLEQERYPDGKSPKQCTAESFAALKKLQGRS
jgi:sugar phosphate isomerase/epimerase